MCEVRETAGDGRHGEGERFGDLSLYVLRYRRVGERERKWADAQRLYTTKEQAKRNGGEGPFVREYDLIGEFVGNKQMQCTFTNQQLIYKLEKIREMINTLLPFNLFFSRSTLSFASLSCCTFWNIGDCFKISGRTTYRTRLPRM